MFMVGSFSEPKGKSFQWTTAKPLRRKHLDNSD